MRILLAEDEAALARAVVKILEKNNYSADAVYNGADALTYLETGAYDAAILDVMMPKMDGITVVKRLREKGSRVPILLLTAKSEIDDKVLGLDSGANDYMTKPFDAKELLARLRVLTRGAGSADSRLRLGNIALDRASFTLSSPAGSVRLANREFQMMELLLSNSGSLLSAERFIEKIWGYETDAEVGVVWVYISGLRKKLEALHATVRIRSVRNAGYTLEEIP